MKNPKVGERVLFRQAGEIVEINDDLIRIRLDQGGTWLVGPEQIHRFPKKKRERTYTEVEIERALVAALDSDGPLWRVMQEKLREGSGR